MVRVVWLAQRPPSAHNGATASSTKAAAWRARTTRAGRVALESHLNAKYAMTGT